MELEEIRDTLRNHVTKHYRISPSDKDFSDDVHLFDYGYVDSLGAVDLIAFVRSTFQIEVSHADLTAYPLNTINEISLFVSLRRRGEL
jgi:methoxymalonate biosynthesis acyl carrier protein